VALARSLAKAPRLLLLDEPMGALDKKLRQDTQFELMDIQEKTGTTFVIVTHDQEEAMTVASRVAVMDEGELIQVATPSAIYEAPNCVYVADFIGDVNIIEGAVHPCGPTCYTLHWAEGFAPLVVSSEQPLATAQKAFLAIRPEKMHISAEPPAGAENTIQGRVHDIAYLGNISTYHVEVAGGRMLKAQAANTRRFENRGFTWDDQVWLSWAANAGVLLEA
jgi:putrescine transport system ATP-binding protein